MKSFEGGENGVYTDEWWQETMKMAPQYLENYVPEGEAFDFASVQDLGAEALSRMTDEMPETEKSFEIEDEVVEGLRNVAVRENLDAWQESMAGTPEEYWRGLEEKWWVDEEIPMDYYSTPKIDVLMEKASEIIRERLPDLSEAGVQARAEMATKVALQGLAEQEANLIAQAKVNHKGERKLKKGWDEKLLHQAYYEMRGDLERIYDEGLVGQVEGDDLSDKESVAWWAASEPENTQAQKEMERLKEEREPEKVEEAEENAGEAPIVKLKPGEAEIVEAPEPIVTMDDIESGEKPVTTVAERVPAGIVQRAWRKLRHRDPFIRQKEQATTALANVVPVAGAEVADSRDNAIVSKDEITAEAAMSEQEIVEEIVGLIGKAVRMFEERTSVLEDYDPIKSDMIQKMNVVKAMLVSMQALFMANRKDFEEGDRQKAAGLELDRTEIGDSEARRNGEIAMELLYSEGVLNRGQSAEEKLKSLPGIRKQLYEKMKQTYEQLLTELSNYEERLRQTIDSETHLKWLAEEEERQNMDDDTVVEYPSQKTLDGLKS